MGYARPVVSSDATRIRPRRVIEYVTLERVA